MSRLGVAILCVAGFACVAIPPTAAGALGAPAPGHHRFVAPVGQVVAAFADPGVAAVVRLPAHRGGRAQPPGIRSGQPHPEAGRKCARRYPHLEHVRRRSGVAAARGARVVNVSADYSTITAAAAPGALNGIANDSKVIYVSEVLAPLVGATGTNGTSGTFKPAAGGCHPTISEGDTLMRVAAARAAQDVNGAGQTIGALSDSFNVNTARVDACGRRRGVG